MSHSTQVCLVGDETPGRSHVATGALGATGKRRTATVNSFFRSRHICDHDVCDGFPKSSSASENAALVQVPGAGDNVAGFVGGRSRSH